MNVLPQEVEVWYIIPVIRKEMAICLSKEYGMSYDKIANEMGLTKTAISQYVSGKRVEKIKMHPLALNQLKISCEKIYSKKSDVLKEIKRILELIRVKKLHCEICGKKIEGELHDCEEIKIPE